MECNDKISQFHSELVLKQALLGYKKSDVLDSYGKLDLLYNEQLQNERFFSTQQINSLNEKIRSQELQLENLKTQNQKLFNENVSLQKELSQSKQCDEERKAYLEKAEMFSTALIRFEQEKEALKREIEAQRQATLEQANKQAQELFEKSKLEYSKEINKSISEIEWLKKTKTSIIDELRKLQLLAAKQIEIFSDDDV